jgi:hypothetical protein
VCADKGITTTSWACVPAGGFKLWEGAVDLCNYLISQHHLTAETLARGETSLRVG